MVTKTRTIEYKICDVCGAEDEFFPHYKCDVCFKDLCSKCLYKIQFSSSVDACLAHFRLCSSCAKKIIDIIRSKDMVKEWDL